jgi:outer membrane protein assembly factor BamB
LVCTIHPIKDDDMKPFLNSQYQILVLLAFGLLNAWTANAQDASTHWPQFRGAEGTGTTDAELPVTWTKENFKWKTELPGKGWSSPIYVDGMAWMTAAIDEKATEEQIKEKLKGVDFARIKTAAASVEFRALCVDLDSGEIVHNIALGKSLDPQPINPMNSYASPSPAIADGKVVCHFGSDGTWCLDATTGELAWETKLVVQHSVGAGSSPIIVDSKVVLVCDGMDKQFVAAVDLATGEEAWRTNRPPIEATNGEFRKSYCTPIVREIGGQNQIVVTGADWICSYRPEDGEELWRLRYGRGYSITGMPTMVDGKVVFVTGYDVNEIVAFDPSGKGQLDSSAIKWKTKGAPTMASIVINNGLIFSANDRGVLSAINPEDGSNVNRVRSIGNLSSSPLLANGILYIANRDGQMVVVRCDEKLEQLFEFDFESPILASPSPVGNDLLVRTAKALIRITR